MSDKKNDDDRDLSVEKEVAPEENIDWLPHPEPTELPFPDYRDTPPLTPGGETPDVTIRSLWSYQS